MSLRGPPYAEAHASTREKADGPERPPLSLERAHVINLAARPERWAYLQRHIHHDLQWDLPLHRFDAIDTRAWSTESAPTRQSPFAPYVHPSALPVIAQNFRTEHRQFTAGAVGCALSHIALWNLLRCHNDWQTLLVFEDDIVWWPEKRLTLEKLTAMLRTIPNDWDLLSLGHIPREIIAHHDTHVHLGFITGMFSYVVHRSGLEKMMRNLFPMQHQIDTVLSHKVEQEGLRIYGVRDNLFDQLWRREPGFGTDCQNDIRGTPSRHY